MLSKQLQFEATKEELNTVPRCQRLVFLLKVRIKVLQGAQPQVGNIDSISSDLQGGRLTSDCHNLNVARASPETKGRMDKMMMPEDKLLNMKAKEGLKQPSLVTGLETAPGGEFPTRNIQPTRQLNRRL